MLLLAGNMPSERVLGGQTKDATVLTGTTTLVLGFSFLHASTEEGAPSDSFNDFEDEDGPFLAWQARGGLQLWTSPSLAWNLGYRFLNIDAVEIDDDLGGAEFDLETSQHLLEIGASFGF